MNQFNKLSQVLKENKGYTRFLTYLGFITSGVITFNAYNKGGLALTIGVFIWLSTTLILESGKAISFFNYVKTKKHSWFTMWVVLTCISIIGNMCFLVKDALSNQYSKQVFASSETKKADLKIQISKKEADKVKIENEKAQASSTLTHDKSNYENQIKEYNKDIKNIQSQINAKNSELKTAIAKKYVKTPSILQNEIETLTINLNKTTAARDALKSGDSSVITSTQSKIDTIDAEINSLYAQYNAINPVDNSPEKETSGISALFAYLSWNWKFAEFMIYVFIATTFEILICMLYLHLNDISWTDLKPTGGNEPKKKVISDNTESIFSKNTISPAAPALIKAENKKPVIGQLPSRAPGVYKVRKKKKVTPKNVIQLVPHSPAPIINLDIDNKIVQAYIDLMYQNATKKGTTLLSDGYKTMGKNLRESGIDISDTITRKISAFLETSNIIEKQDGYNKMVIKADKTTVLKLLKLRAS